MAATVVPERAVSPRTVNIVDSRIITEVISTVIDDSVTNTNGKENASRVQAHMRDWQHEVDKLSKRSALEKQVKQL